MDQSFDFRVGKKQIAISKQDLVDAFALTEVADWEDRKGRKVSHWLELNGTRKGLKAVFRRLPQLPRTHGFTSHNRQRDQRPGLSKSVEGLAG